MSETVTTIIAIAKIKLENTRLEEVYNYMNTSENKLEEDELEIRVDLYEDTKDEDGDYTYWEFASKYLLRELDSIPSNVEQMQEIENDFRKYNKYLVSNSFEIKAITWYNGADMPLFNNN